MAYDDLLKRIFAVQSQPRGIAGALQAGLAPIAEQAPKIFQQRGRNQLASQIMGQLPAEGMSDLERGLLGPAIAEGGASVALDYLGKKKEKSIIEKLAEFEAKKRLEADIDVEKKGRIVEQKQALKIKKEKPKATASFNESIKEMKSVLKDVEDIRNHPGLKMATGASRFSGAHLIKGTPAFGADKRLEGLKNKILLSVLQKLKNLSQSGASGFGQLSEREGEAIRQSIAILEMGLPEEEFLARLDDIESTFLSSINSMTDAYRGTYGKLPGVKGKPKW